MGDDTYLCRNYYSYKMSRYNRENCDNRLRAVVTDKYGRTIALFGKHAFEWEIAIKSNGNITITSYPNSAKARAEFKKLTRKRG